MVYIGYIQIYIRLRKRYLSIGQENQQSYSNSSTGGLTGSLFIPSATKVPCILNIHDMSSGRLNLVPLFLQCSPYFLPHAIHMMLSRSLRLRLKILLHRSYIHHSQYPYRHSFPNAKSIHHASYTLGRGLYHSQYNYS